MRREIALLTALLFLTASMGMAQGYSFKINSANSVIVLPTTKIVNGVPLHIGEDAIAGSKLGAFLVLQGITEGAYTKKVGVPVEYHSVLIEDYGQYYKLNSVDMPDVGIKVGDEPIGHNIVVAVNFSRVFYNSTAKKAQFEDRSVEIIFNENTTPLNLGGSNTKIVSSTVNGRDTLYIYNYTTGKGMKKIDETLAVGIWRIKFQDIDTSGNNMLVEVSSPYSKDIKLMYEGRYYILYLDSKNNWHYEEYTSDPQTQVTDLLKAGIKDMLVFNPTNIFQGQTTDQVIYNYTHYTKLRMYQDGEIYTGQWVWDINPSNNLFTLYLHVNTSDKKFPKVFLSSGNMISLPINGGLHISAVFEKDNEGNIIGVAGYKFIRIDTVQKTVTVTAPKVEVTNNVDELIINDTELTKLPTDRNVIIVGGWVSNKAWKVLEKAYGAELVTSIKNEVNSKGYVVKILRNPYNSNYRVIILAGKTHAGTEKAIKEFMNGF